MRQIKQYTRAEIREMTLKRWKERRKIMEKLHEADKLLKENGFNLCSIESSIERLEYKKPTRQWREEGNIVICFNESKTIDIVFDGEVSGNLPAFIDMQELQAINKKVEELGWLERN